MGVDLGAREYLNRRYDPPPAPTTSDWKYAEDHYKYNLNQKLNQEAEGRRKLMSDRLRKALDRRPVAVGGIVK